MNDKIYLPITNYACYDFMGSGVIRAYPVRPSRPSTSSSSYLSYNYVDFYIHDDYLSRNGTTNFYYNTALPSCSLNGKITDDIFYRQDIDGVLITFLILTIFIIGVPLFIFRKLFKRRSYV